MIFKKLTYLLLVIPFLAIGQQGQKKIYNVGFTTLSLKDKNRIYKPETEVTDSLHYRPVDLDIWYPSMEKKETSLTFGYLFKKLEQRANRFQDKTDYSGFTAELAQFFVATLGIESDGQELLEIKTNSYLNVKPSKDKHPVIIYMAGFNGMGFENYKILEKLAENGFIVISISSVGRYPGDMTNEMNDMLEQVYDAEFALKRLEQIEKFNSNVTNIGVLGCSWGSMAASVLVNKNQNIKAMVSYDGTETHYFGETDINIYANGASGKDNDRFIKEIHDSGVLNPQTQHVKYLYFESGDKLNDFTPISEYHYFKKLTSEKYYLRFKNSAHADFSCIPSMLKSSKNSVSIYESVELATVNFFNKMLNGIDEFTHDWERLISLDHTTNRTFDPVKEPEIVEEISGKIIDAKTEQPLSYVNIGVFNHKIGTVTDIKGNFVLPINEKFMNDTIRISMIGYKSVDILVKDFKTNNKLSSIKLEEQVSELKEVVLTAKSFKKKILGNKTKSNFLGTGFGFDQLGAEMGIKIAIRNTPTFVDAFNFSISHNSLSVKAVFRINFYTIKDGKPFKNICTKNILVPIQSKQTGVVRIDLKPYEIVLKEDVIVTLEWVDNDGKNNKGEAIFFPLGLLTNGTLFKETSQSDFKKHSGLGVGFNIDVRI